MQHLRKSPFGGVCPAAPVDRGEVCIPCGRGDLGGFAPGPVVTPQIVVIERLQFLANGHDRGAGGIDRDGFYGYAVHTCGVNGGSRGSDQSIHVIRVLLRGVVGIFAPAMHRVLRRSRAEFAAL